MKKSIYNPVSSQDNIEDVTIYEETPDIRCVENSSSFKVLVNLEKISINHLKTIIINDELHLKAERINKTEKTINDKKQNKLAFNQVIQLPAGIEKKKMKTWIDNVYLCIWFPVVQVGSEYYF